VTGRCASESLCSIFSVHVQIFFVDIDVQRIPEASPAMGRPFSKSHARETIDRTKVWNQAGQRRKPTAIQASEAHI
jgi:hypothetical protein